MASQQMPSAGTVEARLAQRTMWALGHYHRVAEVLAGFGPNLVRACSISAGQRVLDVGTRVDNVAIPAAATGAQVVASDLTPELFDPGRRAAAVWGVRLERVEPAAEALPFAPSPTTSSTLSPRRSGDLAPNHQAVADELLRVYRPGGVIGIPAGTVAAS